MSDLNASRSRAELPPQIPPFRFYTRVHLVAGLTPPSAAPRVSVLRLGGRPVPPSAPPPPKVGLLEVESHRPPSPCPTIGEGRSHASREQEATCLILDSDPFVSPASGTFTCVKSRVRPPVPVFKSIIRIRPQKQKQSAAATGRTSRAVAAEKAIENHQKDDWKWRRQSTRFSVTPTETPKTEIGFLFFVAFLLGPIGSHRTC